MGASAKRRKRKVRRKMAAVLKWGGSARPRHRLLAGRTGSVHAKKLRSRGSVAQG